MNRTLEILAVSAAIIFMNGPAHGQSASAEARVKAQAAREQAELAAKKAEAGAIISGKSWSALSKAEAELAGIADKLNDAHWARARAEMDMAQRGGSEGKAVALATEAAYAGKLWATAPQAKGQPALSEDQELKLMAINSLRNTSSEEAVPLLEKVLKGNEPMPLKDRALSVLANFETSKAREAIIAVARNHADRDLQLRALRYLGRMDSAATRQVMGEIYKSSTDADVKKTIIRSYHAMDDSAQIAAIARGDSDAEMRSYAVRHLGAENARKELREIYGTEQTPEVKTQILRALASAGDQEKLVEIAKTDKDPKLRREAIRQMSAIDSDSMGDAIVALYGAETDTDVRKEALRTLARKEDVKRLVSVARAEKDPTLKRAAVDYLARMNTKEANDFLLELLNK